MTTTDLMALPDDVFETFVESAVRGKLSDHQIKELKTPEVATRAYTFLVKMKKNVEGQLAAKRADYNRNRNQARDASELAEVENSWLAWRGGALRFKSGVESMMLELRDRRIPAESGLRAERNDFAIGYANLRRAIMEHRDRKGDDSDDADVKLWSMVD